MSPRAQNGRGNGIPEMALLLHSQVGPAALPANQIYEQLQTSHCPSLVARWAPSVLIAPPSDLHTLPAIQLLKLIQTAAHTNRSSQKANINIVPGSNRKYYSIPVSLNALPPTVLLGEFNGIPYSNRFCGCRTNWIDSVDHILLACPLFSDLRAELSFPLLKQDFISLEAKTSWFEMRTNKHLCVWLNFWWLY